MLVLLYATAALAADGPAARVVVPRPLVGHPVFELRVGVDAAALARSESPLPTFCGEVTPLDRLSVEACGNGAGVLHEQDVPDMAHFRVRYAAARGRRGAGEAAFVVGAGLAEVQSGRDAPGFQVGEAPEGAVEAAGGELSAGVKARWWPHERAYVTMEVGGGAAWIPGAPEVVGVDGPVVGFFGLTVGAGF